MKYGLYVVNVEVAVVREGRYLMVLRSEAEEHAPGALAFPGGKVDPEVVADGVLEETARREVREEVGLGIADLRYVESKSFVADDGVFVADVIFLADAAAGEPRVGDPQEVAEVHWMTVAEVLAHPATPAWTARSIRLAEAVRRATAGPAGGLGLDHVQLAMPRGEEAAARRFYGDLVGMAELPKPEPLRARGGVWFRSGELELHLGVEEPFAPARKAHPGIVCPDLDRLAGALARAGFPVQWDADRPGYRRFHSADPFGNRLEFMERGA